MSAIDQVYLINFAERKDKLESCLAIFNKLGFYLYKIIEPNFDSFNSSLFLTKERQSVKSSHVRCVKDAIQNNYTNILIFEDDITFNQSDESIERDILHHLAVCNSFIEKTDFGILYLDNIKLIKKDENNLVIELIRYSNGDGIVKIPGKAYAHSYVLNKSAFSMFVDSQLKYAAGGNDGIIANLNCPKYMYSGGIFDQKLGIKADNKWS